jgi:hypothetical protein
MNPRFRFTGAIAAALFLTTLTPDPRMPAALAAPIRIDWTDGASPLPAIPVTALRSWGVAVDRGVTDADGRVVFRLAPDVYHFRAVCLGYPFISARMRIPAVRRATVVIPHRSASVRVATVWRGEVEPAAGLPVSLSHPSHPDVMAGPSATDGAGRAVFWLPARPYRARTTFQGAAFSSLLPGSGDGSLTIPVGRLDLLVTRGGTPAPGITYTLEAGAGVTVAGTTGADGHARCRLIPGSWRLRLSPDGHGEVELPFDLAAGEEVRRTIPLAEGSPPTISQAGALVQTADGTDRLPLTLALGDGDGDPLRLRIEWSLDGETWQRGVIVPGTVAVLRSSPGGTPDLDNDAPFQIGSRIPVPMPEGANLLLFQLDLAAGIPRSDRLALRFRVTASDGLHQVTAALPEGGWVPFGPPGPGENVSATPADSFAPALALDRAGRPHLAWIEGSPAGDAVAYLRWNGLTWVDADGEGREGMLIRRHGVFVGSVSLALDAGDRPLVAWSTEEEGPQGLHLLRWNGSGWSGPAGGTESSPREPVWPGRAYAPQVRVTPRGDRHLAFTTFAAGCWSIRHLSWEAAGTDPPRQDVWELPVLTWPTAHRLALDHDGLPHLFWSASTTMGEWFFTHLVLADGGWAAVDLTGPGAPLGYSPDFHPEGVDSLHLVWEEYLGDGTLLRYARRSGDGWGSPETAAAAPSCRPSLTLLQGGEPGVAFLTGEGGTRLAAFTSRGAGWPGGDPARQAVAPLVPASSAVAAAAGREPVVAFDDYRGEAGEILCLTRPSPEVALDTAPPLPPGTPLPAAIPGTNRVVILLGSPPADATLEEISLEVAADPGFGTMLRRLSSGDHPLLSPRGYREGATLEFADLPWDSTLHFRTTARDGAGHASPSPSASVVLPRDTFPPVITLAEPSDDFFAAAGSVTLRGWVDEPSVVTLDGDPIPLDGLAFTVVRSLPPGESTLRLRAVDDRGNAGELAVSGTYLPLEIESPRDGAEAICDLIEVSGWCGPACAWVAVGDLAVPALEGRFLVPWLHLEPGPQEVTVAAHDSRDRRVERTIHLTGGPTGCLLSLEALPGTGPAPLSGILRVTGAEAVPGARYAWDLDGDGVTETDTGATPSSPMECREPGRHPFLAVVTTPGGVRHRLQTVARVHLPPLLGVSLPAAGPGGIALDREGNIYYTEEDLHRVVVLSPDLETRFTIAGTSPDHPFLRPSGIALDGEGHLWVCDTGNDRAVMLDARGTYLDLRIPCPSPRRITQAGGRSCLGVGGGPRLICFSEIVLAGGPGSTDWIETNLPPPAEGGVADLALSALGFLYAASPGTPSVAVLSPYDLSLLRPLPPLASPPVALAAGSGWLHLAVLQESGRLTILDRDGSVAADLDLEPLVGSLAPPASLALRQVVQGTEIWLADGGNDRLLRVLLPEEDPRRLLEELRRAALAGDGRGVRDCLHPQASFDPGEAAETLLAVAREDPSWFDHWEPVETAGETARFRVVRRISFQGVEGDFQFDIVLRKDSRGRWKLFRF